MRFTPYVRVSKPVVIAPCLVACMSMNQTNPINGVSGWRLYLCFGSRVIWLFTFVTYVS